MIPSRCAQWASFRKHKQNDYLGKLFLKPLLLKLFRGTIYIRKVLRTIVLLIENEWGLVCYSSPQNVFVHFQGIFHPKKIILLSSIYPHVTPNIDIFSAEHKNEILNCFYQYHNDFHWTALIEQGIFQRRKSHTGLEFLTEFTFCHIRSTFHCCIIFWTVQLISFLSLSCFQRWCVLVLMILQQMWQTVWGGLDWCPSRWGNVVCHAEMNVASRPGADSASVKVVEAGALVPDLW